MTDKEKGKAELEMSKIPLPLPQEEESPSSQEQVNQSSKRAKKKKVKIIQNTRIELPNWRKLTPESANFIYQESEKRLKEILDACRYIQDIAHRLLAILLPIISLAIAYLFPKEWNKEWKIILPVVIFITCQMVSIIFLMLTIRHKTLNSLGSNPIDMLKPEFLIDDKPQYILFVIGICEGIQDKINHNHKINAKIAVSNNIAMLFATIIAPLSFFVTSFIIWRWW